MLTKLIKTTIEEIKTDPYHVVKKNSRYWGLGGDGFILAYYNNGRVDKNRNKGFPSAFREYVIAEVLRGRDTFEPQSIRRKFNAVIKAEYERTQI